MPNDVEFKTFHKLLEAAMRLPPLKIAVVDATAKHVIERAASAAIKGIRSPVSGQWVFCWSLTWCLSFSRRGPILRRLIWLPQLSPVCCSTDNRLALTVVSITHPLRDIPRSLIFV
jgi:hypothetical protein